ncbi:MAG TPA: N-methyl-L-tryptophan oxidase [Candidatus Tumulicola sp.]
MRYDAIVIGLGAMGTAALAHLARRGVRTIGVDRYARGHALGASAGGTRIVRKAYFEDPAYVPLLERAYALWRELEAATDTTLLELTGMLMVGEPDREGIAGTLRSARKFELPLDVYDPADIRRQFPGTQPRSREIGLFEREAGIVFPELAVAAHLDVATANGADVRFDARIASWERREGGYRVKIDDGTAVEASRLVVTAGMWVSDLLGGLGLPLRVQRNVQIWFSPSTDRFDRGRFPAFFVDRADLPAPLYGFPSIDGSLKAALHAFGDTADPERLDRAVSDADVAYVRAALESWMPGAAAAYQRGKVCPYTLTPDGNFIVDRHPDDAGITLACGFSGHGFKFCPVIGEIVADLAIDGGTRFDIDFLRAGRFA